MMFGEINPLNFLVARELAAKQNVDASTATRLALIGTLIGGDGLLGPIIARQMAIREAPAATVVIQAERQPEPVTTATASKK